MVEENKIKIVSFRDLVVYQNTYKVMLLVMREIIPKLPESEKYDLKDQLSRSVKAIPRLIVEGYAKRHQKFGFQKYLDDAIAECNESIVSIEQCRDLYHINPKLCNKLVKIYDQSARQTFKLAEAWDKFGKNRRRKTDQTNTS